MNITDLRIYALMIPEGSITNGMGTPVDVVTCLTEFTEEATALQDHLAKGGIPADFSIFIPDLWHIAKGDACCLPKEDGDIMWNMAAEVWKEAKQHFSVSEHIARHGMVGNLMSCSN